MNKEGKIVMPVRDSIGGESHGRQLVPGHFRISRIGSIRTRLLVAFVLLVLLPAVAISVVSAVTGFQSGREQATNQLELVANFRQAQIDAWKGRLQTNLSAALREGSTLVYAQRALAESQGEVGFLFKRPLEQSLHTYNYRTNNFDELFLLSLDGRKIATSGVDREHYLLPETYAVIVQQDFHGDQVYFKKGLEGSYQVFYSPAENEWGGLALQPVADAQGRVIGVLAGYIGLDELEGIVLERTGVGATMKTYLVGPDHALLTNPEPGAEVVYARSQGIDEVLTNHAEVKGTFEDYRNIPVVGVYRWLPELEVTLVAEQDQSEAFGVLYGSMAFSVGVALVFVLLAVAVSLRVSRGIATPLSDLTETATRIAAGDLTRVAKVEREDEVGVMARAFNSMTTQLGDLIGGLEQRVADRTRDLQAAAEVARVTTSVLDLDKLLPGLVELVRERFSLYYVGLFLVEEGGQFAALRAGTGEAGRRMLAQEHKLEVGGDSMIGQCLDTGQARVALDVGKEAVRFDNPLLPETRSEMALPLRSRGHIIGAMTVQSAEEAAFDEAAISVMQAMADQVAVAIDNARLFAESQAALEAERRAYGELGRAAWAEYLRERPNLGYYYDGNIVAPVSERVHTRDRQDLPTFSMSVVSRGQVIGTISARKPDSTDKWTEEETQLLRTLADQLGQALESARLYLDTQRAAARERLTGRIAARMRETLDLDTVLQTAIREIGEALGSSEVEVRMSSEARTEG